MTAPSSPREMLLGVFGLERAAYLRRGLPADAFEKWDRAFGSAWRWQHDCANELDRARLDRGLVDLDAIVPDPPAWGEID